MGRQEYIKSNINQLFKLRLQRAVVIGSGMFISLSVMDYFAVPEHFGSFFGYRLVAALLLALVFLVARRTSNIKVLYALGLMSVAFSAAAIELMILRFGGHQSSYYVGMILLAICAVAFIPAPSFFHLAALALTYAIYAVPILATERIVDSSYFFIANSFLVTSFSAAFIANHFTFRLMERDFGRQYELDIEKTRSERRFATFMGHLPGLAYVKDREGRYVYTNENHKKLFGEWEGKTDAELHPPLVAEQMESYNRKVLTEGSILKTINRTEHDDGVHFWMEYKFPITDENNEPTCIAGIAVDITDRINTEDKLRRNETSYRTLSENLPGIVYRLFVKGQRRMQFFNNMLEPITGYTESELREGSPCYIEPLIVAEDHRAIDEAHESIASGKPFEIEYRMRHKDGRIVHCLERGRPIIDDEGDVSHVDGIILDITARRNIEEALRRSEEQAQKLEALGELSKGISHDFNNILSIIFNNLELVRMQGLGSVSDYIDKSMDAVNRGKDMIRCLLDFSRGTPIGLEVVNLGDITSKTVNLLKKTSDLRIKVEVDIMPGLWNVFANPSQLQQVVMNLYQNARDAVSAYADHHLRGEQRIFFRLDNVVIPPDSLKTVAPGSDGEFVRLVVGDNGCGMDDDTQSRIFEPFFTTKGVNNRGIGLSAVYGIVKQNKGWIDVESGVGSGTTFSVYLPRHAGQAVAHEPRTTAKIACGSEVILIVDDEKDLADSAAEVLETLGYKVLVSYSGEEALRIYSERPEAIDLVILDLVMPGLSGFELLPMLREINPDVRVLIASGNVPCLRYGSGEDGLSMYLQKPYSMEGMASRIREALGKTAGQENLKQHINRVKLYSVKEKTVPYAETVTSSLTVYKLFKHLGYEPREKVVVLFLDTQKKIIAYDEITQGTFNEAVVHPQEVMRTALLTNASSVILIHNHPAGDLEPSAHDLELTSAIVEACKMFNIEFLDHLIIGKDSYFSFSTDDPQNNKFYVEE